MALPQQAIERLTRAPSQTPGAYQNLLMLTGTVFVLVVITYFGLRFGYAPYLNRQSENLEAKIAQLGNQISSEEQESLRKFYSQLANLSALLEKHVAASPALSFLEKNTLAQVHYSRAKLNVSSGEILIEGVAASAEDVASQASLFEKAENVKRVSVSSVARADKENWRFAMTIVLDKDILLWQ